MVGKPITRISIHAPREGGDSIQSISIIGEKVFQSTPPREGGDEHMQDVWDHMIISIHAPREGGDRKSGMMLLSHL